MATSGWQNEQTIITQTFSKYVMLKGNVYIDTITHSGTNLRITGTIALCTRQRQGSGGSITYSYDQYATPEGGFERVICSAGTRMSVGSDFHSAFDVTIANVPATDTGRNFTVNFRCPSGQYGYNVNLTWWLSFDSSGTAPTGLDVSIASIQDTGATMMVTLSSYGAPSSEANRYIEAAIMGQSTYGGQYRYDISIAQPSATITVNNGSRTNASNPLTIVPNTQYWYGAYATNTVLSTSIVKGSFITLPAYITSITANDVGQGEVYFTVNHASEGTADTAITELSYDQTTWQTVSDNFHLTLTGQTTLYVRRTNSSGSTPVYSISVVPSTRIKLYGSVNGQAQEITKLYGSVNGQSKRIRKLYGSVNGRSKLIFKDDS